MMASLIWACIVVALAGLALAPIALVYAVRNSKLERGSRSAIAACVLAVAPGLAFVGHAAYLVVRGASAPWEPHDLWSHSVALFWLLVAPFVFARSVTLARPLRVPVVADALRLGLMLAWIASSVLVLYATWLV